MEVGVVGLVLVDIMVGVVEVVVLAMVVGKVLVNIVVVVLVLKVVVGGGGDGHVHDGGVEDGNSGHQCLRGPARCSRLWGCAGALW